MSAHARLLYVLLALLTGLRLCLIGSVELSSDEAYYLMWSQHPDISYYSKGPGVAATMWLSTHLFGPTEFGVRFFSPLLALGTSLLVFRLARRLYREEVAFWAVITLNCLPICQVGAVLMTIDPLSLFFWIAAMSTAWRALEQPPGGLKWWLGTGALIGLGFLCKWTNALQLLSLLGLLALTRRYRPLLWQRGFGLLLATFALFTIPPLVWNARNAWITVDHLIARGGLHESSLGLKSVFEFLGGQAGVYSPLLFLGLLYGLWEGCFRAREHFRPRFLLAFAAPIVVLYGLLSFRQAGEPNWTAPAVLSLAVLGAALWLEVAETRRWARWVGGVALAVGAALSILVLDTDVVRVAGLSWPYEKDPGARLRGWRTSAEAIEQFRAQYEKRTGRPVFLIGNRYQTAASLGFYFTAPRREGADHPPVYIPESQAIENQFSFWKRYDGMEDLETIAAETLGTLPAEKRAGLQAALEGVRNAPVRAGEAAGPALANARRALVQALLAARPELPLDEAFVEEEGVSLFAGRDALYVTDRKEENPPTAIEGAFETVELISCLDVVRRDQPLRQWRIFACSRYRGKSL